MGNRASRIFARAVAKLSRSWDRPVSTCESDHISIKWQGGMGTFSYRVQCSAFVARNLKCTAMHQQHYLIQSANTEENINTQPSKKIWKMENDTSLVAPFLGIAGSQLFLGTSVLWFQTRTHCLWHVLHTGALVFHIWLMMAGQDVLLSLLLP